MIPNLPKTQYSLILLECIIKRNILAERKEIAEILEDAGAVISEETLNNELLRAAQSANFTAMIGLCKAGADLLPIIEGKILSTENQTLFMARLKTEIPELHEKMTPIQKQNENIDEHFNDTTLPSEQLWQDVKELSFTKIKNKNLLATLLCRLIKDNHPQSAEEMIAKLKADLVCDVIYAYKHDKCLPIHYAVNCKSINQAVANSGIVEKLLSIAPYTQLNEKDKAGKKTADYAKQFPPLYRIVTEKRDHADLFDYKHYMETRDQTTDGFKVRKEIYDEVFRRLKNNEHSFMCITRAITTTERFGSSNRNANILRGTLNTCKHHGNNYKKLYETYQELTEPKSTPKKEIAQAKNPRRFFAHLGTIAPVTKPQPLGSVTTEFKITH
jgi:hypothetical protein